MSPNTDFFSVVVFFHFTDLNPKCSLFKLIAQTQLEMYKLLQILDEYSHKSSFSVAGCISELPFFFFVEKVK